MPSVHDVFSSLRRRHSLRDLSQFLLLALLLAGAFLGNSLSASGQEAILERDTTVTANAFGTLADGSYLNLSVGPSKEDPSARILCLDITHVDGTYEFGCIDVSGTFWMDVDHLNGASFPGTAIDLYQWVCAGEGDGGKGGGPCDSVYTRSITVGADWAPVGNRQHFQEHQGNMHGPCADSVMFTGFYQVTATTVAIDGVPTTIDGDIQFVDEQRLVRANCG